GSGTSLSTGALASDQTLRFPIQGDVQSLDPAMIDTEPDFQLAHNIFDGLLRFDNNMNVVPDIAASLPTISADGLTYTFKLRGDVTFWNGDKITSQDVLYSWNRAVAMQGPYAANLSMIAGYDKVAANQASGAALESLLEKGDPTVAMSGLSAPDEYTVRVTLSYAAGWFESTIAQPASVASVVDQKVVKNDFENWWSKPETLVGTGAFKMSAHTANESVDFVALSNWWGRPRPTLSKVHIDVVADQQAAIGKYNQGDFDLFGYAGDSPAASDVVRMQSDASQKRQVLLIVANRTYWVTFNMVADGSRPAGGPFTLDQGQASLDLREAFALSVDRAKLAKDLCADVICTPATGGLIPYGLLGYLGDGLDPLATYDPKKAKSLLEAADPRSTKMAGLVYTYDPEDKLNEPTAQFLQSQWQANLGVTVQLRAVPHSTFLANRLKGAYVLSRDGWSAAYNDPQDWFDNLWGTGAGCPDSSCSSGYAGKAYDQLLKKADAEPLGSAGPDYQALSRLLIRDVAYIPLYYSVRPLLIKPYVLGAGASNLFDFYWNQIQIVEH
ncbi:MAG: peptide ABC transporter substrate-binding protein, partial [Isosphaeraceae bacterium]